MRCERRYYAVGGTQPLAGQRAIGTKLTRQARQEPGRADIGKEADADLGHREQIPVAGDAMRAVHREADATTHHDPVDQRDVRFGITLDESVEGVFLAPERQHLVGAAGASEIVKLAYVAARGERALAGGAKHDPRYRGIIRPFRELRGERPHHAERYGIERPGPVQGDETGGAASFEQDFRVSHPAELRGMPAAD